MHGAGCSQQRQVRVVSTGNLALTTELIFNTKSRLKSSEVGLDNSNYIESKSNDDEDPGLGFTTL